MPKTALTVLICVAAFILAPASHYVAISAAAGGFSVGWSSSFSRGFITLLVVMFGWVPGWFAASALSFAGAAVSYRHAVNVAAIPALFGMLSSCAVGPTSPNF
jgi:hypothetical protein